MSAKRVHGAAALLTLGFPIGTAHAGSAEPRFQAMIERPLFSPTRRPPPPPPPAAQPLDVPAAPAPPPAPPDVALSGIVVGGGGGVALLVRPGDAAPVRVAPGGQVDGWTVAEIHPRAVVLRRDGRSVTVALPTAR